MSLDKLLVQIAHQQLLSVFRDHIQEHSIFRLWQEVLLRLLQTEYSSFQILHLQLIQDIHTVSTDIINIDLTISTTGINTSIPSNAAYLKSNSLATSAITVFIELRTWIIGEYFSSTGACIECTSPDFYSLELQATSGSCKSWQTRKMYCNGGSNVGPKPGYWRSSLTSDNFISWLYYGACLGYVLPTNNKLGECFEGYQGILCADWKLNFSRTGNYGWSKWPDIVWNIFRLVLLSAVVVVWIIFMIRSTFSNTLQVKNVQSVYIRILMNHLQLLVITASFNFNWPSNVNQFFDSSKQVAQVTTQFLSFDWFLDQRNNGGSNLIRLYYQKMIMYALLPFIVAIISAIFWFVFYKIAKDSDNNKRNGRIIATVIILMFLVHPTIVQYMFSNFK